MIRRKLLFICLCMSCLSPISQSDRIAHGDIITVSDADFVNGIYEFRYYSQSNMAFVNGNQINLSSLVLTNNGITGPATEGSTKYWHASGFFNASQAEGAITMGWDFSGVSKDFYKLEVLDNSALFQFDPWTTHAFEDVVFGEIATPTEFGNSAYNRYFEFVGDNLNNGGYSNVGEIQNVTSFVSDAWLNDPQLFELRLGYQQHMIDFLHPNIPGKHIQFFRDGLGQGDSSFLFRVSAVPEPNLSMFLLLAGTGFIRQRRRFRKE